MNGKLNHVEFILELPFFSSCEMDATTETTTNTDLVDVLGTFTTLNTQGGLLALIIILVID